jgi:hypothetical protein
MPPSTTKLSSIRCVVGSTIALVVFFTDYVITPIFPPSTPRSQTCS